MPKKEFNSKSAKTLSTYILTLTAQAGVIPLRGGTGIDRNPDYQATLFRAKVGDWLEANGDYQKRNVLTTAVVPTSHGNAPRMSITCTAETLARVQKNFGPNIMGVELVQENVRSRRVIKRPDVHRP